MTLCGLVPTACRPYGMTGPGARGVLGVRLFVCKCLFVVGMYMHVQGSDPRNLECVYVGGWGISTFDNKVGSVLI